MRKNMLTSSIKLWEARYRTSTCRRIVTILEDVDLMVKTALPEDLGSV